LFGDDKGEVGQGAIGTLVGEENRGLEYMFIMMNAARFAVGVQGIGVSEASTQKATAYARDRVQSRAIEGSAGPVPIIRHPDVQRMLMTMRALTEGARALACMAAAADDFSIEYPEAELRREYQALYDYLVPVVKGFSTECSLEVSSLGVQVHGGMGFIEETGAAQFYRDARILTIYEGTTAIQANDLIGRKTLRDGGATAQRLSKLMKQTVVAVRELAVRVDVSERAGMRLIADNLLRAVTQYDAVIDFVLAQTKDQIRAVYAGSVPYLMLTGYVLSGWLMARAALACAEIETENNGDAGLSPAFMKNKVATAIFYAGVILPRTQALADAIHQGVVLTQAVDHSTLML
jgi:hypothetical protein